MSATTFEQKFSDLAHELLKMMKGHNLFIISWQPPQSPYSKVKDELVVEMVWKEQFEPGCHILSDDEILSNREALNYLFSWGVELALPEDE